MYCPYIADAFINANDTAYFDMSGVLMYDPVISNYYLQTIIPATQFVTYWSGLFPFNDTFRAEMHKTDKECGLTKFVHDHLVYPPKGNLPNRFPGENDDGSVKANCINSADAIVKAILPLNPCFNIYQITTMCPMLWDVVGFPGTMEYLPDGAQIVSTLPVSFTTYISNPRSTLTDQRSRRPSTPQWTAPGAPAPIHPSLHTGATIPSRQLTPSSPMSSTRPRTS